MRSDYRSPFNGSLFERAGNKEPFVQISYDWQGELFPDRQAGEETDYRLIKFKSTFLNWVINIELQY